MCDPFAKREMVYSRGHRMQDMRQETLIACIRTPCGVTMPEGLKEKTKFLEPVITPSPLKPAKKAMMSIPPVEENFKTRL